MRSPLFNIARDSQRRTCTRSLYCLQSHLNPILTQTSVHNRPPHHQIQKMILRQLRIRILVTKHVLRLVKQVHLTKTPLKSCVTYLSLSCTCPCQKWTTLTLRLGDNLRHNTPNQFMKICATKSKLLAISLRKIFWTYIKKKGKT